MKTWLSYLGAAAMGLAIQVLFKDNVAFYSIMANISAIMITLGAFIVFPMVLFTMASGTASLGKTKGENSFVWVTTIFWAIFTTLLMAAIGALAFNLFPATFPITTTVPSSTAEASALFENLASITGSKISANNPIAVNSFTNLFKSSDCFLCIIVLALVFGYAARPTTEVMRPAYQVLNSVSEVMFRLARQIAKLLWIGIFFIAGSWFAALWYDKTIFFSYRFVILLVIASAICLLVLIPFVFCLFTGFKRNPYRQILRLISAATASFFSVNYLFSQTVLYTDCRINLGIQKKVVSTALPLHSLITKGGTAMLSTLCSCSLCYTVYGSMPTITDCIAIAIACSLVSFICCLHAGYEVLFASSFAFSLMNGNFAGYEFAIVGILPVLNGLALLFDTVLSGLGTSYTAYKMKADSNIREADTV
ncbi:MAG: dicarboxylate/amino acid:cation symporter [Sphaerochaetaceae bacterium]|nr:dicarboxylate/amino acid:cation symporter [Sphaerochaetaceae bacterium]